MNIIKNTDINNALEKTGRVYLCGKLTHPNAIKAFLNDGYEIGISYYKNYTFEQAHYHERNTEYNYILEGCAKVLLLDEGKEYLFEQGDMFIIEKREPYVVKYLQGSRNIFSKEPGGNDKISVAMGDEVKTWGQSWEATCSIGMNNENS